MSENTVLKTLKTSNAILLVLALALFAQMPHAADVFRMIGHADGIIAYGHSYGFAFALELAVLVFVVQNRQIESYCFAGVSVAMNLSYYALTGVSLFSVSALPAWLVSVALPVAIARYSHAVVETPDEQHTEQPQPRQKRITKTVRVTSEQSEQYTVVQPEQLPVAIEQPQANMEIVPANDDEQRRDFLRQLLKNGEQFNRTKLASEWGIGRTTLYAMIAEAKAEMAQ